MPDAPPPPLSSVAPPSTAGEMADVPRQLAAAEAAWRPVRRAVRYATFDAWTLAVFAVLSVLCVFGGLGGVAGLVVAAVLGGLAFVEFEALRRLRRLDPAAPRRLAVNQLALAAAVVVYAAWNLYLTWAGRGVLAVVAAQASQAGLTREDLATTMDTVRTSLFALYVAVGVIGGLVPAATAWFYHSRTAQLQAYLARTPAWVVRMQRERGTLASGL